MSILESNDPANEYDGKYDGEKELEKVKAVLF